MKTIVLVHGLPGSGKTTLSDMLHKIIGGARINADLMRATISQDLKFGPIDREIQAYRMGKLANLALITPISFINARLGERLERDDDVAERLNRHAIVDFVCPTERTRKIFEWSAKDFAYGSIQIVDVWMNTITGDQSRFPDTVAVYEQPSRTKYAISGWKTTENLKEIAHTLANEITGKG
jgi:adenylylsulfate kinase